MIKAESEISHVILEWGNKEPRHEWGNRKGFRNFARRLQDLSLNWLFVIIKDAAIGEDVMICLLFCYIQSYCPELFIPLFVRRPYFLPYFDLCKVGFRHHVETSDSSFTPSQLIGFYVIHWQKLIDSANLKDMRLLALLATLEIACSVSGALQVRILQPLSRVKFS